MEPEPLRVGVFSAASAVLFMSGWKWFYVSFVATHQAWWNSPWMTIAIFACGTAAGIESMRGHFREPSPGCLLWIVPALNGASMLMFLILLFGQ